MNKCKNCCQPIEFFNTGEGIIGYWRHVRDSGPGRIWCYPNAQEGFDGFDELATPDESANADLNKELNRYLAAGD